MITGLRILITSLGVGLFVGGIVWLVLTMIQISDQKDREPFNNYVEWRTPSGALCVQTRVNMVCDFSGVEK